MIYLISGVPGSGKSTITKELVKKFKKGFLIETDILREFVVSGYASPTNWTEETESQFELATYNTCALAKNAQKYGFDVIIDDAVSTGQEKIYKQELPDAIRIFLSPSLEVILARNKSRGKFVDETLINNVYERLLFRKNDSKNWINIDTSNIDPETTVKRILDL
jgi:gluconate kinase